MDGRPDILAPTIGLRRPAFNTAAGRTPLSRLPDAALDHWLDHLEPKEMTNFTLTDKRALRAEILRIREQGYAITAQEMRRGFHAIAVPLRRYDGVTIAAVSVAGLGRGFRGRHLRREVHRRAARGDRGVDAAAAVTHRRMKAPFVA